MPGPAAQHHVDRLAAVPVGQLQRRPAGGLLQVAVAPAQQADQHRVEVHPGPGQPVLVPGALPGLPVRVPAQHARLDQRGQPGGEHLPGRADPPAQVVEAPDPGEDLAQHQQRPLLPDQLQGAGDRAGVGVVPQRFGYRHASRLSSLDRPSKCGEAGSVSRTQGSSGDWPARAVRDDRGAAGRAAAGTPGRLRRGAGLPGRPVAGQRVPAVLHRDRLAADRRAGPPADRRRPGPPRRWCWRWPAPRWSAWPTRPVVDGGRAVELGVVVADRWQRHGLGWPLCAAGARARRWRAACRCCARTRCRTTPGSAGMLRRRWPDGAPRYGDGTLVWELPLRASWHDTTGPAARER